MRMRKAGLILMLGLIGGCASRGAGPASRGVVYEESPAATGLVFTPAVAQGQRMQMVPRDARELGIFVGYEELSTTYFYIRRDDRQSDDYHDRYTRRAVIEKVGVSYR